MSNFSGGARNSFTSEGEGGGGVGESGRSGCVISLPASIVGMWEGECGSGD